MTNFLRDNIIFRLVFHYTVSSIFFIGLLYIFPDIREYVLEERNRIVAGLARDLAAPAPPPPEVGVGGALMDEFAPARTVPVMLSLSMSLVLALPLTWVYTWTRKSGKYDQSFTHTLLVIPIAIALVVFLVKGSLALAFSLAGIVAAVRFRTNLKQPMDGVYLFMAIGIGLAAGTQLTTVAFLASVFFTAVTLGLAKSDYAATPVTVSGWRIVRPEKKRDDPEAPLP